MSRIKELNDRFGIGSALTFNTDASGLIIADIKNQHSSASIALQGAHLMSWAPVGASPVIWLSPAAKLAPGSAMRGGVPICWPWFGAHETNPDFPSHGFARTAQWEIIDSATLPDGATAITLELPAASIPAPQWPGPATLRCQIRVGSSLSLALITRNTGQNEFTISEALHTYFCVSDVRQVTIDGLDGCRYLDKVDNMKEKQQSGAVTFTSEVDRVYLDTEADCIINDPALSRQIRISKTGSLSTVVWNPWSAKATAMSDMEDDGYLQMVCVESGNAAKNRIAIAPGDEHRLVVSYHIETY